MSDSPVKFSFVVVYQDPSPTAAYDIRHKVIFERTFEDVFKNAKEMLGPVIIHSIGIHHGEMANYRVHHATPQLYAQYGYARQIICDKDDSNTTHDHKE